MLVALVSALVVDSTVALDGDDADCVGLQVVKLLSVALPLMVSVVVPVLLFGWERVVCALVTFDSTVADSVVAFPTVVAEAVSCSVVSGSEVVKPLVPLSLVASTAVE